MNDVIKCDKLSNNNTHFIYKRSILFISGNFLGIFLVKRVFWVILQKLAYWVFWPTLVKILPCLFTVVFRDITLISLPKSLGTEFATNTENS